MTFFFLNPPSSIENCQNSNTSKGFVSESKLGQFWKSILHIGQQVPSESAQHQMLHASSYAFFLSRSGVERNF